MNSTIVEKFKINRLILILFLASSIFANACSKNPESNTCNLFQSEVIKILNEREKGATINETFLKFKSVASDLYPKIEDSEIKDSIKYIAEINTSTSEQENAASLVDILSKLITIKQICGWTEIG
jgi:hypothetical protein